MRKANLLIGVGPVFSKDIEVHRKDSKTYAEAKIKAAEVFLRQKNAVQ